MNAEVMVLIEIEGDDDGYYHAVIWLDGLCLWISDVTFSPVAAYQLARMWLTRRN